VRTLPERDAEALLAVTAELLELEDAVAFPPRFLGRLAALLRSPEVDYSDLDRGLERSHWQAWWREGETGSEVLDSRGWDARTYFRLRHEHPTCGYRERANEWTTALKVSDFVTRREFRRTRIWNELYREDGVDHWMDVGLRPDGTRTRMLIFTRRRGDFDERDRLVLELLQPHLQRRHDRVTAAAEAADALASLEERGADDPRHVVLCTRDGVIEFASPQSRRLLAAYFGSVNGRLSKAVLGAVRRRPQPLVVERGGWRLTVRATTSAGLVVLLLGEEDTRLDRLTPRQRTILAHVARGQTDAQIAATIGIAPATVNKHLEQIYRRLGVHTRTAAAAVSLPAPA
jgi:DNA-binding CsgD family transcriptional regulator